jgi:hypothetical protein
MKKFVSLGLALMMCLALMIPAFASEQTFATENESLTPTIEVDMPSSAGVILNPYGMTYKGGILGGTNTSSSQIISNVFAITNKTQGCNLEVKATVTGVMTGNAQLVDDKDKNLENDSNNTIIGKKFKAVETANKVMMALSYNFTGTGKENKDAPTSLDLTKLTRTANYKKFITDAEQSLDTIVLPPSDGTKHTYIVYQFSGIAVPKPTEAWSEADTVGATFVYTFTATPDAPTAAS